MRRNVPFVPAHPASNDQFQLTMTTQRLMVSADWWRSMIRRRRRLSARDTVERADKGNDAGNRGSDQR